MLHLMRDERKLYLRLCSCDIPISKHTSFTVFFIKQPFHIAKPMKKCTTSPSDSYDSLPLLEPQYQSDKLQGDNINID